MPIHVFQLYAVHGIKPAAVDLKTCPSPRISDKRKVKVIYHILYVDTFSPLYPRLHIHIQPTQMENILNSNKNNLCIHSLLFLLLFLKQHTVTIRIVFILC